MTFNQEVAVWTTIGIWLGAIATFCAVAVSLWLARRSEKVDLSVYAGLRVLAGGGVISPEQLHIGVTNKSVRPVTISLIGWGVGKRRNKLIVGKRRYKKQAVQSFGGHPQSADCPKTLVDGETAMFIITLEHPGNWLNSFVANFLDGISDRELATLTLQVHTSIGQTVNVKPESRLFERLRATREELQRIRNQYGARAPAPDNAA